MSGQITTAAELDALPVGSVVLDSNREAWQSYEDTDRDCAAAWVCRAYNDDWTSEEICGERDPGPTLRPLTPLTVLYRPDALERTEPTEEQVRTLRGQLFDAGYREAELLAENKAFVEEIREAKAEAWDEGLSAAYGHVYRQEDADAAGQGVLIPSPANPYRSEADHG